MGIGPGRVYERGGRTLQWVCSTANDTFGNANGNAQVENPE
jgi:hypothetical protein